MQTLRSRILEGEAVADILAELATQPENKPQLPAQLDEINASFGGETVEKIIDALTASASDWAQEQLKTLSHQSPTSQRLTLGHLRAALPMEQQLEIEFRMTQHCMVHILILL